MKTLILTDTQSAIAHAIPLDSAAKPGSETAPPTFASSDPTIATVTANPADPTGNSAIVKAIAPGACVVTANGTNASGTFYNTFNVTVTGGQAVTFDFSFDAPY